MNGRLQFLLLCAFAATAVWVCAQPTEEELEQQRQRLEAIRKHPDELARLRDNYRQFQDLPTRRREAILKLDRDLHDLPAYEQVKLSRTLDAYADWLERLRVTDPATYQAIREAPNTSARLALIQERRDRDWVERQPRAIQEKWKALQGEARSAFVSKLREEQRQNHQQWVLAKRFWDELEIKKKPMPSRLADFSDKVRGYVHDFLLPYVTVEEKARLVSAEGRWPDYPIALVEIASKRPSALPPDTKPIRKFSDLPDPVQAKFHEKKGGDKFKGGPRKLLDAIKNSEGAVFTSKLVEIALREKRYPFGHEFLAANDNALSEPMQVFVDKALMPALKDQAEKRKLVDSLGKWPEYPLTIQELARKHDLTPPWHILPDAKTYKWDLYRDMKARSWGFEVAKDRKPPP